MVTVPERFAADTVTREGTAGQAWLDQLPKLIGTLCRQWRLEIDGSAMHGYLGLVIPVRRDENACVLKVTWIEGSTMTEPLALATWNGHGAVRMLEAAPQHGAMLLERLDFKRSLNDVAIKEAVPIAGRLLRRLAVPAPVGIMTTREWTNEALQNMPRRWEQHSNGMPRQLLNRTCELANQLLKTTSNLLVNYDLHYLDTLASEREPWLIVDPKVVVGEPEFGVAQLLWTRLEDMEAEGGFERYFRALVEAGDLDLDLASAWTQVRCVDYWLWGLSVGLTYDPARCEAIVHHLA